MDLTEEQILKIALIAINKYCKQQDGDDACVNCMFDIKHNHCMFGGPNVYEGVIPEDWELSEVEFMKKGDEKHENE